MKILLCIIIGVVLSTVGLVGVTAHASISDLFCATDEECWKASADGDSENTCASHGAPDCEGSAVVCTGNSQPTFVCIWHTEADGCDPSMNMSCGKRYRFECKNNPEKGECVDDNDTGEMVDEDENGEADECEVKFCGPVA